MGTLAHDRQGRRIGGQCFELAQQTKVGNGRATAKEVVVQADMAFEQVQAAGIGCLDNRRVLRSTAHERHAFDLALGKTPGRGGARVSFLVGEKVIGDPERGVLNVSVIGPAVMKHGFGQPFVSKVFNEVSEEGTAGRVRNDRPLAWMALLQLLDNRR